MAGRLVGKLGAVAAALSVLAAGGVVAHISWLPGFVETQAEKALREAGFQGAELVLDHIGLGAAELTVELAGGQGIDLVHLDYSPAGLWNGRLDRIVLRGARLEIQADAGGVRPTAMRKGAGPTEEAALPDIPVGEIIIQDARLDLLTPAGPIALPLDAVLRQPEPGRFLFDVAAALMLGPVSGKAGLKGSYGPEGVGLEFRIDPDRSEGGGTVAGAGRLAWAGEALPAGRAELEISGAVLPDGTPFQASLRWLGEGGRHELQGLLRPGGDLSVQLAGVAERDAGGAFRVSGMADVLAAELAEAVRLAGLDLPLSGAGAMNLRVADAPIADGMPPMDVSVRLDRAAWAGMASDAVVTAAGRILPVGEGWRFESADGIGVEAVPHADIAAVLPFGPRETPLFLSLGPAVDGPLELSVTPAGQGWQLDAAGRFGVEAGQIAAGGGLEGLGLTTGPAGIGQVTLAITDTSLDAPPWALALRGLGGTVAYATAADQKLKLRASADTVRMGGHPAPVAPFALNLAVTGDPSGMLTFQGDASAASGSILLEAFGTANLTAGTGQADFQLYPVRFGPGGRTPAELSPLLASYAEEASGTVALKARAGWGKGAGPGRAELLLEDISLTGPSLTVQGVNGVITAGSLQPLRMPEQELSIGLLEIGIPLSDGLLRFAVPEEQTLQVAQAQFAWAGGIVRAQPFKADVQSMTGKLTLEAQRLELGQVLAMAGVDGLAASGTLNGRIPVVVEKDAIRFVDGRLDAAGEGTLRYDPADPPAFLDPAKNDSTGLVMQALQNFHYTELGITIDGAVGGEMEVKLRVRGANPDFYDGYPVALNLNLSGALASILQSGVTSYRIPETVRARIEQFRNTGQ